MVWLNEKGILVKNYQPKLAPKKIVETYKKMVVGREVDKKMMQKWNAPESALFMSGASKIEFYNNHILNPYNIQRTKLPNNENILNEQYKEALTTSNKIKFTIDSSKENAFPWLD